MVFSECVIKTTKWTFYKIMNNVTFHLTITFRRAVTINGWTRNIHGHPWVRKTIIRDIILYITPSSHLVHCRAVDKTQGDYSLWHPLCVGSTRRKPIKWSTANQNCALVVWANQTCVMIVSVNQTCVMIVSANQTCVLIVSANQTCALIVSANQMYSTSVRQRTRTEPFLGSPFMSGWPLVQIPADGDYTLRKQSLCFAFTTNSTPKGSVR